jgi:hypothetical protein
MIDTPCVESSVSHGGNAGSNPARDATRGFSVSRIKALGKG